MNIKEKPSKKIIAQVEQDVYAATVEACEDNNAFFLLALNQEFGFGPERLRRMIHKYNELSEEYTIMRKDGFSYEEVHQKMCDALASIGIDPDQVYVGTNDFYDIQRQKRYCERESKPTRAEAGAAYENMQKFKAFLADNENQNLKVINAADEKVKKFKPLIATRGKELPAP